MNEVLPTPNARAGHAPSWYAATANPLEAFPRLEGAKTADICVVGAGYTGLSTALNLAERGYKVVVLEAKRVGWGASGRNGGQIGTAYAPDMDKIVKWVGREDARKLWDLAEEGKRIIFERVARHGIRCDLARGYLMVALKPRQLHELETLQAQWRDGYRHGGTEILTGDRLRAEVASEAYIGGLSDPSGGHFHPLNYCLGLAAAARHTGVEIYEDSAVTALDIAANIRARTMHGQVSAEFLVLAGNAYLGDLVPSIRRKIMPVGTYIAATEPLAAERVRALIPNDLAVCDINFVLNYFRRSRDNRLLFGGRVSYSTLTPHNLVTAMRRKMLEVFPQLGDVGFDYAWGGNVAITMERSPHLGRLSPKVYFAHGFSGQGVAITGIAGKVVAEAIAGQAERFDLFTRLPHTTFPGGPWLRTPTLVLAMLWYRLRDFL